MRGDEHRQGHAVRADFADHAEPVEARHRDIEQHQIERCAANGVDRFPAVAALFDNFDIVALCQQHAECRPRRRLVVHDRDA